MNMIEKNIKTANTFPKVGIVEIGFVIIMFALVVGMTYIGWI